MCLAIFVNIKQMLHEWLVKINEYIHFEWKIVRLSTTFFLAKSLRKRKIDLNVCLDAHKRRQIAKTEIPKTNQEPGNQFNNRILSLFNYYNVQKNGSGFGHINLFCSTPIGTKNSSLITSLDCSVNLKKKQNII